VNPTRCFCIQKVNTLLKKRGTTLVVTFSFKSPIRTVSRVVIRTEIAADPIDETTGKRRRLPLAVLADFCPFCGKKYPVPISTSTKTLPKEKPAKSAKKRGPRG
jgi:hypothetical protein